MKLTFHLIFTLGCSGLALGLAGAAISMLMPVPSRTVLLDRSYCSPDRWQAVVNDYDRLHTQHRLKIYKIKQVVAFSNLGSQPLSPIPAPEEVRAMNTFGRSADEVGQQLLQDYSDSTVLLSCS